MVYVITTYLHILMKTDQVKRKVLYGGLDLGYYEFGYLAVWNGMAMVLENQMKRSQSARGGRRSPAVACWASDHWVASSNPLRGKFRH